MTTPTNTNTPDIKTLIEGILERYGDAYYFKFSHGDVNDGTIECVMNGGTDDNFEAEGYRFHVDHHDQRNINDDDTDPETNGGIIDIPTHDIYTISYEKI